jgi:hypothetical protein
MMGSSHDGPILIKDGMDDMEDAGWRYLYSFSKDAGEPGGHGRELLCPRAGFVEATHSSFAGDRPAAGPIGGLLSQCLCLDAERYARGYHGAGDRTVFLGLQEEVIRWLFEMPSHLDTTTGDEYPEPWEACGMTREEWADANPSDREDAEFDQQMDRAREARPKTLEEYVRQTCFDPRLTIERQCVRDDSGWDFTIDSVSSDGPYWLNEASESVQRGYLSECGVPAVGGASGQSGAWQPIGLADLTENLPDLNILDTWQGFMLGPDDSPRDVYPRSEPLDVERANRMRSALVTIVSSDISRPAEAFRAWCEDELGLRFVSPDLPLADRGVLAALEAVIDSVDALVRNKVPGAFDALASATASQLGAMEEGAFVGVSRRERLEALCDLLRSYDEELDVQKSHPSGRSGHAVRLALAKVGPDDDEMYETVEDADGRTHRRYNVDGLNRQQDVEYANAYATYEHALIYLDMGTERLYAKWRENVLELADDLRSLAHMRTRNLHDDLRRDLVALLMGSLRERAFDLCTRTADGEVPASLQDAQGLIDMLDDVLGAIEGSAEAVGRPAEAIGNARRGLDLARVLLGRHGLGDASLAETGLSDEQQLEAYGLMASSAMLNNTFMVRDYVGLLAVTAYAQLSTYPGFVGVCSHCGRPFVRATPADKFCQSTLHYLHGTCDEEGLTCQEAKRASAGKKEAARTVTGEEKSKLDGAIKAKNEQLGEAYFALAMCAADLLGTRYFVDADIDVGTYAAWGRALKTAKREDLRRAAGEGRTRIDELAEFQPRLFPVVACDQAAGDRIPTVIHDARLFFAQLEAAGLTGEAFEEVFDGVGAKVPDRIKKSAPRLRAEADATNLLPGLGESKEDIMDLGLGLAKSFEAHARKVPARATPIASQSINVPNGPEALA